MSAVGSGWLSPYRNGGPTMTSPWGSYRTIELTKGQVTIVDDVDYDWLNQWLWHADWNADVKSFYACRTERINGKYDKIRMHRFILGLYCGDARQGDHANRNTLDNRRSNLRIASHSQNTCNRRLPSHSSSGFRGVTPDRGLWKAVITFEGRKHFLGRFQTKELAHAAYCEAAQQLHGEFASFS